MHEFYFNHLNECDNNPSFGDEITDFFPLSKLTSYSYHLFPKLDLNLIEKQEFMRTTKRKEFIERIFELVEGHEDEVTAHMGAGGESTVEKKRDM